MIFLLVFASTFTIAYIGLLRYYRKYSGMTSIGHQQASSVLPFCSLVIAVRNEELNIRKCLESVTTQTYPVDRYEILVVNDGSEDDTVNAIRQFPAVHVLHTPVGLRGKKHALSSGIGAAQGEIIITTDGDCQVHPSWLQSIVDTFDDSVQMVTGPVLLSTSRNAFERFQALDIAGLAMITAAGIERRIHHLANGANMAFRKSAFDTVGGFSGNAKYASGDDVFLVQAIAKHFPGSIRYVDVPEAVVLTDPCFTIQEFMQQRLRWATKNSALREKSVFSIWLFIWMTFAMNLIAFGASLVSNTLPGISVSLFLIVLIALSEYVFLRSVLLRYHRLDLLHGFPVSFALHYLYVLVIGFSAVMHRSYIWKGRRVR